MSRAAALDHVVWELTLACDQKCLHCGSRGGKPRRDELSTAEALDLVDAIADLGAMEVTLIGGEAYLRRDWSTIAAAVVRRGMQCSMVTGGRHFDAGRAAEAAAAGINNVSLSLDGIGATHDQQRGPGSFAAALGALRHLRAAGVHTSCNTQISRASMPELPALLDLLVAEGAGAWLLALAVPMGRAADHPGRILQPLDLLELMPLLADLALRGDAAGVQLWPGDNLGYFGPFEHVLRGRLWRGRPWNGCGAGTVTLGIESDGTVKGCSALPRDAYAAGNIRETPLRQLWEQAPALSFNRERTGADLGGFCRSCYYADACLAGCTWTTHVVRGERGDNPYCHHRVLTLGQQGVHEVLVPLTAAPGLPFDQGEWQIERRPLPMPQHSGPLQSL